MGKTMEKIILIGLLIAVLVVGSMFVTGFVAGRNAKEISSKIIYEQVPYVKIAETDEMTEVSPLVETVVEDKNNAQEDENDGEDIAITGNALEKASAAALKHIGKGKVTDTEKGDEEGYYEVEITLNDKRQVDVHLDENFKVISEEWEDNEEDDDEEENDEDDD